MRIIKKIEIAAYSGFCFGVNRAMEIANRELDKKMATTTYAIGPLIHNEQAMEQLKEKNLIIDDNIDNYEKNSSAIIRSHGLPKVFYDRMEEANINIIDATCPFVKKIQNIVFEGSKKGYNIIIVGDKNHPEVKGIIGWSQNKYYTINSIEEAENFSGDINESYLAVVQTTFNMENYDAIEILLKEKLSNVMFNNTICYATKQRQESAEELSKKADAMIVIGGKNSSNTMKLADICKKHCKTLLIETAEDLDIGDIKELEYIGIVAGASTPDYVIQEVYDYIVNKINV